MDKVWRFSRSHDQCYIDCPRKAFLNYYYGGKGIVRKGLDLYQQTGTLCHEILQAVMTHAKVKGEVPDEEGMDVYCSSAVQAYREEVEKAGFTEVTAELELEMQRQCALAEGLARVWTLNRLPYILERYNIVAVEEEHIIPISDGIELMSRLDGVLERKDDGEYFAGPEFKTTGWMSDDYLESFRYSIQTMTHCLDIEHKYGKQPAGVAMEFLYKGSKRKGDDGTYTYYSPLVRAYKMTDDFGNETYGFDSALGRKRDWKPFDPYVMGMGLWVKQLPEEVVNGMLFNAVIYRDPREVDTWKRQAARRQNLIKNGIILLETEEDMVMDAIFPARMDQFCYSNQYKKKCPYLDICYNRIDDPLGSGAFVVREPHHAGEWEDES